MDVPVPDTNKDAERVTLPRVASPSSSNFEEKIVIVTAKRVFYIYLKESEIVRPAQETGAPASAEFVTKEY